ncbi:MAG TPA: hypothetical protein VL633_06115 [Bacteroidota bacterium]|jgi:hypothetical protein|nr:hypothetical protein [Bacteroidota bacterium]
MAKIFRNFLSNKIFSFFFTIIVVAVIAAYCFGVFHAYQHTTLLAFLSGFTIVPAFYYAYEYFDVPHYPCSFEGCHHVATQASNTLDGMLYICDEHLDGYKRLK